MVLWDESPWCRSGRHAWTHERDRVRCCNGYRRELYLLDELPADVDPQEATPVRGLGSPAWWVWVRVEQEEAA